MDGINDERKYLDPITDNEQRAVVAILLYLRQAERYCSYAEIDRDVFHLASDEVYLKFILEKMMVHDLVQTREDDKYSLTVSAPDYLKRLGKLPRKEFHTDMDETLTKLQSYFDDCDADDVWHPEYAPALVGDTDDVDMVYTGSLIIEITPSTENATRSTIGSIEDEEVAVMISDILNAMPNVLSYILWLEYSLESCNNVLEAHHADER